MWRAATAGSQQQPSWPRGSAPLPVSQRCDGRIDARDRREETVASARNGLDMGRDTGRVAQRGPYGCDRGIEPVFGADPRPRPETVVEFRAQYDVAGPLEEDPQHAGRELLKRNEFSSTPDGDRVQVELEGTESDSRSATSAAPNSPRPQPSSRRFLPVSIRRSTCELDPRLQLRRGGGGPRRSS